MKYEIRSVTIMLVKEQWFLMNFRYILHGRYWETTNVVDWVSASIKTIRFNVL